MPPVVLLTYYCLFVLLASIVGGMIPVWFQLTHRWMEIAVSFVAGVMLGVGVLLMLPHALADAATADPAAAGEAVRQTMLWLLAGMLVMFFIERFFCFHHHDAPDDFLEPKKGTGAFSPGEEAFGNTQVAKRLLSPFSHDLTWSGAALGMTLHSILDGFALAASAHHGSHGSMLAGFGTFLVVFLHKPFDAMTIGMLMARGRWSLPWRHLVNALFSLAIPVGVLVFYFGVASGRAAADSGTTSPVVAYALAFSAGTFLCISLSDLLPELQFHRHDRVKLSLALLLGLAVAYLAGQLEAVYGSHTHPPAATAPSQP